MRRFWIVYAWAVGIYAIGMLTTTFGPVIEAAYYPVRIDQSIDAVERTGDRLCWDWVSDKVRPLASDDMDAYLHDRLQDRMVTSICRAVDGMPWRSGGAMGVGHHRLRYCVTLPPHVLPTDPVSVEMRAWYPGAFGTGLWRFPLILPRVESPGATP